MHTEVELWKQTLTHTCTRDTHKYLQAPNNILAYINNVGVC